MLDILFFLAVIVFVALMCVGPRINRGLAFVLMNFVLLVLALTSSYWLEG